MISAIVAIDSNYGIGYKGDLLYKCSEDMKHFKELTSGHTVIMGRKTFDSIGKPLPNRENLVVTSNPKKYFKIQYQNKNLKFMTYVDVLRLLENEQFSTDKKIFIIGGEGVYRELIDYCTDLYITKYDYSFKDVDVYFPKIDELDYVAVEHILDTTFNGHKLTIDRYSKGIEKYKI